MLVKPQEVFYLAVHRQVKYVILAHNHPHENITAPSVQDIDATDHLMHAAELLYIKVIDHLNYHSDEVL